MREFLKRQKKQNIIAGSKHNIPKEARGSKMSGQINFRDIFNSKLRDGFFFRLAGKGGPLNGWDSQLIVNLVDQTILANKLLIDSYLQQINVNVLNMPEHIDEIIDKILLPYLNKQRVT